MASSSASARSWPRSAACPSPSRSPAATGWRWFGQTWGPKVANTFLKKQQRKIPWEDTRLLNEMEEQAKEYEEEAIAREERLMMQVEDHRGNQQDQERRYLATERTLRMPGYVAKGDVSSASQPTAQLLDKRSS